MAPQQRSRPPDKGREALPSNFQMFAESMFMGIVICVLGLLLVTIFAAVTAGIGHLHRHTRLRSDTFSDLWSEFLSILRRSWPVGVAFPLVMALLLWNLDVLARTPIPGGPALLWVMWLVLALVLVLVLRSAAAMALEPGLTWKGALQEGLRATRDDIPGTVLLLVGLGLCAVFVWMLLPLVALAPGLMSFATLAVETRRKATTA